MRIAHNAVTFVREFQSARLEAEKRLEMVRYMLKNISKIPPH